MKMSKRLMAWLLCCMLLMTSTNVVWAERDNAMQTAVGSGASSVTEPASQATVGSDTENKPDTAKQTKVDATATPATEQGSSATPTPATEQGSGATPTPATEVEAADATPTPAPEAEAADATPTPTPEVDADATPTPAPMRMMGSSISLTGEFEQTTNSDSLNASGSLDVTDAPVVTNPSFVTMNPSDVTRIYTVTYDLGANTAATLDSNSTMLPAGAPVGLPTPNNVGAYTFKGWKYADNYVDNSFTMPDADVTLVAQWEVATVAVTDLNTPEKGDAPDYDITVTPAAISPGMSVKWYDGETEFNGTNYAPATAYTVKITLYTPSKCPFASSVTADGYVVNRMSDTLITLSKTFPATDALIYTVTYDVSGNSKATAPEAQRLAVGASVDLPTLEDVGSYTFEGWTLNDVKVNSPFTMPDGNVTLKAVWEPVTVTIKYRWNNTDHIFTTKTYNVSKYYDVYGEGKAEIGSEADIILDLDKWGRYIYAIMLNDDGASHIRPVNSSSYRTITINADSSKNVVDVPCYLECTLRPATYELTYDGTEQLVGLITRNVYDNVHGYTANFSNHSYSVGANPGIYKYDGETVTLQKYIVDSTGRFTTDTIDFVDDLKIVKRPVNISLDPLEYTVEYADGSLTSFPKVGDVKYTVAEGDANSGLVSGHSVVITDVKYGLADSAETFASTAKPGSYVVKSYTCKIYDENNTDVTANYEVNVDSPNPALTIHKGTLRAAVNTPTESTYNGRLTREICPETEPSLSLKYEGKQIAFVTEEVNDAGTYCFTHFVAEGEFGYSYDPAFEDGAYFAVNGESYRLTDYFNIDWNTVAFTITPKPITVTANPATRKYGEANPAFTFTAKGLVEWDVLNGAPETDATAESMPGKYNITQGTLTNENNPNYNITFIPGTLTVTKLTAPDMPSVRISS